LAKRTLQTRALHLRQAVSRSGSRCWAHTVGTEGSRVKNNQSDNRVSVQPDVQLLTIIQIENHTQFNTRISQRTHEKSNLVNRTADDTSNSFRIASAAGRLFADQPGLQHCWHSQDHRSSTVEPVGISILPGQDFWIANNNSGTSTLYDNQGNKDTGLVVTIPGATRNPNGNCRPGCPTGNVSNGNGAYFNGGQFIFDTEDGLIASWTGASNTAAVAFDNSASGAVYKGLASLNSTFLLAATFNSGRVDVLDRNFNLTSLGGSFTDPKLPVRLRSPWYPRHRKPDLRRLRHAKRC